MSWGRVCWLKTPATGSLKQPESQSFKLGLRMIMLRVYCSSLTHLDFLKQFPYFNTSITSIKTLDARLLKYLYSVTVSALKGLDELPLLWMEERWSVTNGSKYCWSGLSLLKLVLSPFTLKHCLLSNCVVKNLKVSSIGIIMWHCFRMGSES